MSFARGHEPIAEHGHQHLDGNITILRQIDVNRDVFCLSYTETYDFLAAGLADGNIRLYQVNNGDGTVTLSDNEMTQRPSTTTAIKHRPVHKTHPISQTILASYANGCVKCWHYPSSQCLYTIHEKRQTLGLVYHPNLPKFITIGDDAALYLYDEETRSQERIFRSSDAPDRMDGHTSRVFAACFHPRSNHEVISAGWDDTIQFWDCRQPYALRRISGVHVCGDGLDINKNGKEILSCSWQRKDPLQLWDYGSGRLIVSLEPDSQSSLLYCGKYINNLFITCAGSDKNLIRVVDLRSHASIAIAKALNAGVYGIAIGQVTSKNAQKMRVSAVLPKLAICFGKSIWELNVQPP